MGRDLCTQSLPARPFATPPSVLFHRFAEGDTVPGKAQFGTEVAKTALKPGSRF